MIKVKIKFAGKKITLRGTDTLAPGFDARRHAQLGQIGLRSLRKRVSKGVGADDTPMPPLKENYRKWKRGKKIRDLWLTGKMLLNLSVRWASDRQVNIALTTKKDRTKALMNQRRARWLAWSPNDQRVIVKAAKEMFHQDVTAVKRVFLDGGTKRRTFSRNTAQFSRRAA